jgi:hypothetical protein
MSRDEMSRSAAPAASARRSGFEAARHFVRLEESEP